MPDEKSVHIIYVTHANLTYTFIHTYTYLVDVQLFLSKYNTQFYSNPKIEYRDTLLFSAAFFINPD